MAGILPSPKFLDVKEKFPSEGKNTFRAYSISLSSSNSARRLEISRINFLNCLLSSDISALYIFHFAILDDGGRTNEIASRHLQGNYSLNVFQDVQ